MSSVVYLFGSGIAFFAGAAIVLSAIAISFVPVRFSRPAARICAWVGFVLIALSAAPLPYWWYGILVSFALLWTILSFVRIEGHSRWRVAPALLLATTLLVGIVMEAPYQMMPTIESRGRIPVYVVGDSISAGLSDDQSGTWPDSIKQSHSVEVSNLAKAGASVSSALQQADRIEPGGAIVLVEIGGNDLLGTTTASDYEKGLAFLLGALSRPEREVVMFELPLLPFKNQFGRIQRRLASAHGVKLIPKRALISVLTSNSSTLDSIHLSPRGHAEMAALVWPILKPACESAP